MKSATIIAFIMLFSWSGVCLAYYVNGNTLVLDMYQWQLASRGADNTDYVQAARYSSYILGVYDALSLTDVVCASAKTDAGRITNVVAKYLQAHPDRWGEPAYTLVADALTGAYACKAQ